MDFRDVNLKRVFIGAALLTFLFLSAHEAFAHAGPAVSACHNCAAAASPKLNSDYGSELPARPDNFILTAPATAVLPAAAALSAAFRGRAPPL